MRNIHGEERNRRIKRTYGSFSGITLDNKEVSTTFCDSELSVVEKYCEYCNDWISTEPLGLLGFVICPCCKNSWNKNEVMNGQDRNIIKNNESI